MTDDEQLWQLEDGFWLGDAGYYEQALAPEALMVLPAPAGVLDRLRTIESIRAGPRWQRVAFHARHLVRPHDDAAVLVYAAVAHRAAAGTPYRAQCSSTYVRRQGRWQLVLHHQAP